MNDGILDPDAGVRVKQERDIVQAMSSASTPSTLRIGALARATDVSVRAIRHYDQQGLLTSTRAGNGYRMFPETAVTKVRQIQRLRAMLIEGAEPEHQS